MTREYSEVVREYPGHSGGIDNGTNNGRSNKADQPGVESASE